MGQFSVEITRLPGSALGGNQQVAVMNGGRIEQCSSPSEIYDQPATSFVAQFIGTSNFFEGKVLRRSGDEILVETSTGLRLTAHCKEDVSSALLCLRPESISLAKRSANALPQQVDSALGIVERLIHRGATSECHVRLETGEKLVSCHTSVTAQDGLTIGSPVLASWSSSRARVLHRSAE
jgi:ABC-type Fe3+/spermidine/putrescine transport system ATPase subunit